VKKNFYLKHKKNFLILRLIPVDELKALIQKSNWTNWGKVNH